MSSAARATSGLARTWPAPRRSCSSTKPASCRSRRVCSVGGAARSFVLLGDPQQLPQVSQGTHPEGAEASALEHLLDGARTIAPDRGLFLETTYRLHPEVNAFVSDAFYEGRLEPDAANATQDLAGGVPVGGEGVRFVGLPHAGGRNRSPEEAEWVVSAIEALKGRPWTDRKGNRRVLDVPDVLVVAPYNAQVAEIASLAQQRLGVLPNVGTVDKFQGREAPVAIYSMTTSSPEDAPRDIEFLYSGNRLNVAISRARGLAVLVASPDLLRVACQDPGADAARQRVLPVHRDRRRAGTPRRPGGGRGAGVGVGRRRAADPRLVRSTAPGLLSSLRPQRGIR